MITDGELLWRYAKTHSEDAFEELVRRHLNLVYSAALRQVNGDVHLAQDVTQTVFTDLARKAALLSRRAVLTGWLYTSTHFAAAKAVRSESRRHAREQEAHTMRELLHEPAPELDWQTLRPVLDAAMHELKESDREAILLRYFENRALADVGVKLGVSENAARMRVERALEKLRTLLARRGIASAAAAIGTVLSSNAVQLAPAGLVASITTASLAGAAGTGITLTMLKLMTMNKLATGIIGAVIVAGVATPLAVQHQEQVRLRHENATLQATADEVAKLVAENQRLSNLLAQATDQVQSANDGEVLRLRAEVTALRRDSGELAKVKRDASQDDSPINEEVQSVLTKIAQLKQAAEESPDKTIPEFQFLTPHDWLAIALNADLRNGAGVRYNLSALRSAAKDNFAPRMAQALRSYTQTNGGQLPTDIIQLRPFFESPVDDSVLQRYQMIQTGNVSDISGEMLVHEKAPVDPISDSLFSIGLDRYTISMVNSEVNGRGARGANTAGSYTKFIPGIQMRSKQ